MVNQWESVFLCFLLVVCLTVSEVKVRQMPPKPFRERAKKMSADRTAEKNRNTEEFEPKSTLSGKGRRIRLPPRPPKDQPDVAR